MRTFPIGGAVAAPSSGGAAAALGG